MQNNTVRDLVVETRKLMRGFHQVRALYHKHKIKLGRTLIALKRALKHGQWEKFYEKTFADSGISLWRAQRYMRLAREEAGEKRDRTFLRGTDREMLKAVEKHNQAIEEARRRHPEYIFRPGLHFSNEVEQAAMEQFWKSNKQLLDAETVALWRQMLRASRRAA